MQQHQFHSSTRKKRLLCSAEQIGITSEASNFVGSMCAPYQRMIEPAGRAFEQFANQASSPETTPDAKEDEDDPSDNPIAAFFTRTSTPAAEAAAPVPKKAPARESTRSSRTPPTSTTTAPPPRQHEHEAQQQHAPLFGSFKSIIKDGVDLYEVLEVGHLGELATPDEIRKACLPPALPGYAIGKTHYFPDRRLALRYHPDKRTAEASVNPEEINQKFRQINEAFNVLNDPFLRRQYDSVQPFDDRIPTERQAAEAVEVLVSVCSQYAEAPKPGSAEAPALSGPALSRAWDGFSRLFEPVFRRNARWSVERPVPPLGDLTSSREQVEHFYTFWRSFRTWREFPSEEELDLSEATSRDERRWMERQNVRLRAKPRRLEYQRIAKLVDTAYRYDPRIRKFQQDDAEARAAAAKARLAERMQFEARERLQKQLKKEAEERQQQALLAEQALRKKEKKVQKADQRKARARLRQACQAAKAKSQTFNDDDVEILCSRLSTERLNALAAMVESFVGQAPVEEATRSQIERDFASEVEREKEKAAQEAAPPAPPPASGPPASATPATAGAEASASGASQSGSSGKPWTLDEINLLNKAIRKYPSGTRNRWELVAASVRTHTEQECIAKTRELQSTGAHVSASEALAQFLKYTHSESGPAPAVSSLISPATSTTAVGPPGTSLAAPSSTPATTIAPLPAIPPSVTAVPSGSPPAAAAVHKVPSASSVSSAANVCTLPHSHSSAPLTHSLSSRGSLASTPSAVASLPSCASSSATSSASSAPAPSIVASTSPSAQSPAVPAAPVLPAPGCSSGAAPPVGPVVITPAGSAPICPVVITPAGVATITVGSVTTRRPPSSAGAASGSTAVPLPVPPHHSLQAGAAPVVAPQPSPAAPTSQSHTSHHSSQTSHHSASPKDGRCAPPSLAPSPVLSPPPQLAGAAGSPRPGTRPPPPGMPPLPSVSGAGAAGPSRSTGPLPTRVQATVLPPSHSPPPPATPSPAASAVGAPTGASAVPPPHRTSHSASASPTPAGPSPSLSPSPTEWTADEQRQLEQGLRTYAATLPDRWDLIAALIPTRTKKECIARFKELAKFYRAAAAAAPKPSS